MNSEEAWGFCTEDLRKSSLVSTATETSLLDAPAPTPTSTVKNTIRSTASNVSLGINICKPDSPALYTTFSDWHLAPIFMNAYQDSKMKPFVEFARRKFLVFRNFLDKALAPLWRCLPTNPLFVPTIVVSIALAKMLWRTRSLRRFRRAGRTLPRIHAAAFNLFLNESVPNTLARSIAWLVGGEVTLSQGHLGQEGQMVQLSTDELATSIAVTRTRTKKMRAPNSPVKAIESIDDIAPDDSTDTNGLATEVVESEAAIIATETTDDVEIVIPAEIIEAPERPAETVGGQPQTEVNEDHSDTDQSDNESEARSFLFQPTRPKQSQQPPVVPKNYDSEGEEDHPKSTISVRDRIRRKNDNALARLTASQTVALARVRASRRPVAVNATRCKVVAPGYTEILPIEYWRSSPLEGEFPAAPEELKESKAASVQAPASETIIPLSNEQPAEPTAMPKPVVEPEPSALPESIPTDAPIQTSTPLVEDGMSSATEMEHEPQPIMSQRHTILGLSRTEKRESLVPGAFPTEESEALIPFTETDTAEHAGDKATAEEQNAGKPGQIVRFGSNMYDDSDDSNVDDEDAPSSDANLEPVCPVSPEQESQHISSQTNNSALDGISDFCPSFSNWNLPGMPARTPLFSRVANNVPNKSFVNFSSPVPAAQQEATIGPPGRRGVIHNTANKSTGLTFARNTKLRPMYGDPNIKIRHFLDITPATTKRIVYEGDSDTEEPAKLSIEPVPSSTPTPIEPATPASPTTNGTATRRPGGLRQAHAVDGTPCPPARRSGGVKFATALDGSVVGDTQRFDGEEPPAQIQQSISMTVDGEGQQATGNRVETSFSFEQPSSAFELVDEQPQQEQMLPVANEQQLPRVPAPVNEHQHVPATIFVQHQAPPEQQPQQPLFSFATLATVKQQEDLAAPAEVVPAQQVMQPAFKEEAAPNNAWTEWCRDSSPPQEASTSIAAVRFDPVALSQALSQLKWAPTQPALDTEAGQNQAWSKLEQLPGPQQEASMATTTGQFDPAARSQMSGMLGSMRQSLPQLAPMVKAKFRGQGDMEGVEDDGPAQEVPQSLSQFQPAPVEEEAGMDGLEQDGPAQLVPSAPMQPDVEDQGGMDGIVEEDPDRQLPDLPRVLQDLPDPSPPVNFRWSTIATGFQGFGVAPQVVQQSQPAAEDKPWEGSGYEPAKPAGGVYRPFGPPPETFQQAEPVTAPAPPASAAPDVEMESADMRTEDALRLRNFNIGANPEAELPHVQYNDRSKSKYNTKPPLVPTPLHHSMVQTPDEPRPQPAAYNGIHPSTPEFTYQASSQNTVAQPPALPTNGPNGVYSTCTPALTGTSQKANLPHVELPQITIPDLDLDSDPEEVAVKEGDSVREKRSEAKLEYQKGQQEIAIGRAPNEYVPEEDKIVKEDAAEKKAVIPKRKTPLIPKKPRKPKTRSGVKPEVDGGKVDSDSRRLTVKRGPREDDMPGEDMAPEGTNLVGEIEKQKTRQLRPAQHTREPSDDGSISSLDEEARRVVPGFMRNRRVVERDMAEDESQLHEPLPNRDLEDHGEDAGYEDRPVEGIMDDDLGDGGCSDSDFSDTVPEAVQGQAQGVSSNAERHHQSQVDEEEYEDPLEAEVAEDDANLGRPYGLGGTQSLAGHHQQQTQHSTS